MKKFIAILIVLSMLTSFAACNGQPADGIATSSDTVESGTTAIDAETARSEITDNLPESDFDGYKFRMLGRKDNFVYEYELGAAEQNGDVVNDAAFTRNQAVEDRLNIEIESTYQTNSKITNEVRQFALAGDDAYDLVINASWSISVLATENLLTDWYAVPYVDFERAWWSTDAIGELSVNNHTYFAVGDLTMSNIGIAMCIFYNKTLGKNYQLDNIYETILDGKWTYDYFTSVVKNIYQDLNGNSVMDENDIYGFGNNIGSTLQPFVFSLGARFTEKDENDIPRLSMNNEKFISVFEKIYALHLETDGVYASTDYKIPRNMFANGQIVFNTGAVYHAATIYREMTDDFGIIPFPKADENMEKYYTCHDPNVSLAAMPITVSDISRTGLIVEALAVESYKTLTPAFYETALQVKYSRDDETVKMLDLIRQGVTFDFAILYGSATDNMSVLSQSVRELLRAGSKDFVSFYAENAPAVEAYFNSIIDSYLKLE